MAAFEKETIFSLEEAIEYTDGGVISKQVGIPLVLTSIKVFTDIVWRVNKYQIN
ncbi:hypothetical protein [Galbibacter marinus]|uniref:hypothetical protein n=1 Tax=Galbibacter marinus TaxID=555500 RepID=UPI00030518A2|nr:hypothetical protein [Galbibacter marinus]